MASLRSGLRVLVVSSLVAVSLLLGVSSALFGICGPFTDVAADAFCPFVLEVFYLGVTTGTTPTTYDPTSSVSRLQMAAFLSRAVDGTLRRANRRAAANKFWTPKDAAALGVTTIGPGARLVQYDGGDLWVAVSSAVARVRASDGRLLETWTGATTAFGVVVALGRVLVTGQENPGRLFAIDPTQPAGAVTTVASNLGGGAAGIAFDGSRVWTANVTGPGSVSIITPGPTIPWTVTSTNVTLGSSAPAGIVYDGSNIWVTDAGAGTLIKLNSSGGVLQTLTVGGTPFFPVFDGTNLWIPNQASNLVSVVRASTGAVLQTLTGNGLDGPAAAGFDGERILVTNIVGSSVSLWKAADLTALGSFEMPPASNPEGIASDGLNFWIGLVNGGKLVRF